MRSISILVLGAALAAGPLFLQGCKPAASGALADVSLPTLGGGEEAVRQCSGAKCALVYVAPWCPYCVKSDAMIRKLKKKLGGQGVPTRVVVGRATAAECRKYAREFGPETLLDPDDRMKVRGVPHFYIHDSTGKIIRHVAGTLDREDLGSDSAVDEMIGHLNL